MNYNYQKDKNSQVLANVRSLEGSKVSIRLSFIERKPSASPKICGLGQEMVRPAHLKAQ